VLLSDEQLRRYDEDGFLAIDRIIDDDTVAELRVAYGDILNRLADAPADHMLGGRIRVVTWPAATHAAFKDTAALAELNEIADQVLGEATGTFDMLIYKPPGDPEATPWHQDLAYFAQPFMAAGTDIPSCAIRFWVALDDVDEENGACISCRAITGSHCGSTTSPPLILTTPAGCWRSSTPMIRSTSPER